MSNQEFLLYGANGYTGELVAREAGRQGLRPVLAGRNETALKKLAGELGLDYRVFGLDDRAATDKGLAGGLPVLNCAGPFSRTVRPLAEACIRNRVHYLDIAGEAAEFEQIVALDETAKTADVMLLPGVGFGIVPTDCLALHLKERLPTATSLRLGFQTVGGVSRGTLATMLPDLHKGGVVRQNGQLQPARAAWHTQKGNFGDGPAVAVTNPWRADTVAAFYSTGIGNIEGLAVFPAALRIVMRASRWIGGLFDTKFVQKQLAALIGRQAGGPSEAERSAGRALVWGEAQDGAGQRVASFLRTPDAYDVTVQTALASIRRVLDGAVRPGFQTPAAMFGADFILQMPGVSRFEEVEETTAPLPMTELNTATETNVIINQPPTAVYDRITTPHTFPPTFKGNLVIPAMSHEELTGGATKLEIGLIRHVTDTKGQALVEQIGQLDRPNLYAYDIIGGIAAPLSWLVTGGHTEWRTEAVGGQTRLGWIYSFKVRSWFAYPVAFIITKIFLRSAMHESLVRIKNELESNQ